MIRRVFAATAIVAAVVGLSGPGFADPGSVLAYTGPMVIINGQPTTLVAALTQDGTTPIAGRSVTFVLGTGSSTQSCAAVTDATGNAACTLLAAQPLGSQSVSASFAGDGPFPPAATSANAMVAEFASGGAFVIGDGNAAVGSPVEYWGAQWAKLNTLSGGDAPRSFKGFADTLASTPPACGGTWTTRPGNSSGPPDSVPSYMAALVSSAISKSGPTIAGDTPEIVVIKTDPGYAADPGHAGTGTVVAVLCPPPIPILPT